MSDLREKHRTTCGEIEHLGFVLLQHIQYLRRYPDSNGDSLGIGKCCYEIIQKLVTLKKLAKGLENGI
jgi:hypothetical protein